MALVVKDRVRETTTTAGTGTVTLAGAVTGFQSFSVIGNSNTTFYCIVDTTTGEWEVGIGTYSSSGTTLSRDTVLESSTGGTAVSFAGNTKDVFCTYPAERSVYVDGSTITPGTSATLPVGSVGGLGTNVATALAANVGTAGSFVVNGGALGTPSSGTVTNLTGTASININGTVGATTPTTGSFTTATATTGNITTVNATTVDTTNIEVTNIKAKDGTAAATIADSTGKITVSTELAVDNLNLSGNTVSSTDTNGNIVLAPNGTGDVQVDADTLRIGDSNANATLTTNGTGDLILNTNAGTNSSSITIQDAANGNIVLAPNGTGRVQVSGTTSNSAGIELFEDTDNGTNKVTLTVPASIASDVTATIPATTTTLAGLAVTQTFSVSQRGTVTTDNDGSFDMNATNNFLCTPTAGFALTFTNITAGQSGNIILVNGSNYAITAAAATKVSTTTLATISATGTYWLSYFSPDGTNVYVSNTGALA